MQELTNIREQVKSQFAEMQTKEDFLNILNFIRPIVLGKKSRPFKMSQLSWYYNVNIPGTRYKEFSIKKKNGHDRQIHAPVNGLKYIQKILAFMLECVFEPHVNAYGFVRGKSIVDNAARHSNNRYVFNIDLKDFFPSIDQARVWKCLQLKPFNLKEENDCSCIVLNHDVFIKPRKIIFGGVLEKNLKELFLKADYGGYRLIPGIHEIFEENSTKIKYNIVPNPKIEFSGSIFIVQAESISEMVSQDIELTDSNVKNIISKIILHQQELCKVSRKKIANIIASLCCTKMEVERRDANNLLQKFEKNVLPQGAPTSPIITNIVCQRLDHLLTGLANRFGVTYSRYADDITFSSNHHVYSSKGDFIKELNRIILDQHFEIKSSKTRLQKAAYRQEVTGLLVNRNPNVHRRYVKQLRSWIHIWEKFGYQKASRLIVGEYMRDKGNVKNSSVKIENLIRGKLDFLKMVKGHKNPGFVSMFKRYEALCTTNPIQDKQERKLPDLPRSRVIYSIIPQISKSSSTHDISAIIESIFELGLDDAMDKYQP